jgi:predicted lactoylglutathione lyase
VTANGAARQASATFVNLPVADLKRSIAFFEALGFAFDAQYTDDTAACLVLGPNHYAMLITELRFKDFTPYPIVDARRNTEVLVALQLGRRAEVDEVAQKAFNAGGKDFRPAEDHGWMYARAFQDLDGHIWEPFCIDEEAMKASTPASESRE